MIAPDAIEEQMNELRDLACDLCPRCGRGEGLALRDGTWNHVPEPCEAEAVWRSIAELYEQLGMELPR